VLQSSTIACFLACLLLSQGFPTSSRASRITDCCEVTRLWRAPNWWEEQRVIARFPSCRRRAPWAPANLASHPRTRNGPTTTTSTFPSPYCTHKLLSHNSSRFLLGRYHDQQHACCCSLSLSLDCCVPLKLWCCYVVPKQILRKGLLIAMEAAALVLLCCSTQILSIFAGCNMRLRFCNVVQTDPRQKEFADCNGSFGFAMLFNTDPQLHCWLQYEALDLQCCSTQILSNIAGCSNWSFGFAMLFKQILSSKSCWWPASEAFGCCGVQINSLIAVKSITLNQLQIPFNLNLEHNCSRTQKDERKMASVVYTINLVKETWKIVRLKMLLLGFTNLSLWETNFMDHGTIVVGTRIFLQ